MLKLKQRGIYSEYLVPNRNKENQSQSKSLLSGPSAKSYVNAPKIRYSGRALNPLEGMPMDYQMNFLSMEIRKPERDVSEFVEIEPKVMESYNPIPGRVHRKVDIERKKRNFSKKNIVNLFNRLQISMKLDGHENWLELGLFDDERFDDYSSAEWMQKAEESLKQKKLDKEQGILTDRDELGEVKVKVWGIRFGENIEMCKAVVESYNEDKKDFEGYWEDTLEREKFKRIQICFETEDPEKYIERLLDAIDRRKEMATKLKYQHYIDSMPTEELNEMEVEQKERITKGNKKCRIERVEENLLEEIELDYSRTMNKIIFDSYIKDFSSMFEVSDVLAQKTGRAKNNSRTQFGPPSKGIIQMSGGRPRGRRGQMTARTPRNFCYTDTYNFDETFKEFCFSSLFIKKEAIEALQEIRVKCIDIQAKSLFSYDWDAGEIKRVDEFKTIQESAISQLGNQLKGAWINSMIGLVKGKFGSIGKGWFNMKETNKLTYEYGKLKRFLTVIRLNMQDSVFDLLRRSLEGFVRFFKARIPERVTIVSENEIANEYAEGSVQTPVLSVDFIQVAGREEFNYLFKPEKIKLDLLQLFEKAVEELKTIPDLEPKILEGLNKAKKSETFILTPVLPKRAPEVPDPRGVPKRYADENKWVWDLREELRAHLERAVRPLTEFRRSFDKYRAVLGIRPEEFVSEIASGENQANLEFIKGQILKWQREERRLKQQIPEEIQVGCFVINCKEVLRILLGKYQEINKKLIEMLARKLKESGSSILRSMQDIEKELYRHPEDIESLSRLKEFVEIDLPQRLEQLEAQTQTCVQIYEMLETQSYKLKQAELNNRWKLIGKPREIRLLVEEKQEYWDKRSGKLLEEMEAEQSRFVDSLNSNKKIINSLYIYNNLEDHRKNKEIMDTIKQKLVDIEQKTKIFNNRETMFAKKKSDYSMLLRLKKNFEPYLEMWTIVNHWKEHRPRWLHDYWGAVDAQSAEQFVDLGVRALVGVVKHFREKIKEDPDDKPHLQNMILIAQSIRREIEDFKPKVPLLVALKKPGMQRRHWEEIFGRIGQSFIVNDTLTFQTLLDKGMLRHIKVCCEVGEKAEREFHIEKLLTEMQTTWEEVAFSLVQYKRTGVWVIQNYEEIENKVDEHLGTTQMLLVNPFNRPFQQVIDKWFNQLLLVNNTLEEWKRLQVHWCYLQPIFDSADIVNELPNASTMFKKVDNYFTKTMSQTKVQKKVLKVCVSEDHYDNFIATNRDLDKIQRALKNYLEKKKSVFGRFYFLSNDALLSILSETKEVERIQDHLRKVFENIARLNFSDEKHILGMSSVEKEYIPFEAFKVVPTHKPVERWMKEVEDSMQRSVRRCMLHAIAEYPKHPRIEWIMRHPGQCVLNGSQTFWTSEVEAAVGEGALAQYLTRLDGQIQDIVQIDRTQLSRNQLVTLEALLVLDVHARNVVKKLVSAEIDSVFSFEWISQLRYYIENEQMRVKCLQTDLLYGNEYLGNTNRLVITPLTDKCYMTLMSALKLNLGGSPMGPAGTGKTESTKDLAKALAKQIVVFNCQESMDHQFLAQYFKGLASTGAWCCFDEFNRINVEVLSVIAQQLQELFRAKNEDRKKLFFENSEIELVNTFSVFITMNPNYAGRQTLPDNLKALFRPVAMMVPNYRLIAQIKLYSFGFLSAPVLAKKMVATFKLSSEQLSEEYHYDYGMRAVSTLINAAGLIKQKNPDMPEDQILLKALKDVNEPKFLEQDQPLFKNIIKDLFPEVPEPERNYDRLQETLAASCLALNLQKKPDFLQKVYQLHDTIQVRHAVMLVGPSGGGKSSVCNALRHALCRLNPKKGLKVEERIVLKVINPKAVDMDNLYGVSRDLNWHEGIIEVEMEKAIENQFHETKSEQCFWILFDGPVDPSWIESMNTVLDDNRKLCLSSAKVLMLSQFITMMFEVDDVSKASLATISRCGMVYMEPEQLGHGVVVDSFLDAKNPKLFTPAVRSQFKDLQARILEPTLAFVRKQCKELVATADCNLVSSFCTLFNCFMQTINLYNFLGKEGQKELEKYILTRINNCFLFCLTWSVCASIDRESRIKSVFFLSKLLEQLRPDLFTSFPGEIYDFNYDFEENSFAAWTVGAPAEGPQAHFTEIVVPTKMFQSNLFLQSLLLRNKIHVLIPGPTGTGKSTNCLSLLSKGLDSNFISASIVLSAQTHQDQIQELIFSQIIKRKRAVFGPASGKRLVVFIDDMNMPQKQFFGDQPPLELTRQILDRGGCYVWKSQKEYICLEDVFVLAAMNPHTRDPMPPRLVRQFFVLGYPELEKSTLAAIFDHLLSHSLGRYNEVVKSLIPQLIELQLSLFEQVRAKLLPIPSKPHYQFNLRDISRVFQGVSRSTPKTIDSKKRLVQLWNHENCRVFRDRLTDKDDELLFDGILEAELAKLDLTPKDLLKENSRIIFADFLDGVEAERNYQHIESTSFFIRKLESILRDFNEETQDTSKKLDLVLFLDACEHISRISRIISQPEGHALLLGVGGSGRRSLSKLSAYINMHKLYTVEVGKGYNFAKWREDLKDLILQAVAQNRQLTFLVSDTQMVDTRMLEDINCLLNTGNILGMQLNQDEKKKVDDAAKLECSKKGLTPTQVNLQQQAVQLVKMNTHVVFCMSPLREGFLDKLRMFPSLISCCTIDWFHEWPKQALLEVAHEGLAKLGEESNPKLEEFFARAQIMAKGQSEALRREQKRHNFVTPTIYLELLKSFDMNLKEKQKRNRFAISRLKNGLEKLKAANKNMELIHEQLEREKPTLRRTEIEVKEMISTIEEDKKTADTKRDHIINEEKKAIEAEREASKLAKEVEESVNEVDRKLKKTRENINQLKQDKITFLRNLDNPTVKIRYCYMAAVLLLMDYSELEVRNSWTETEKVNYFMKVFRSRFLKDPKFLDNIKNMDYKNVPATRLVKIKEMVIEHPLRGKAWNKTDMHKSSFACYCLYLLIQAALEFNKLYQVTQPLRDKQIRIDKSLREKRMQLIERKKEIHDINQKLDELENLFEVKNREKNLLKEKIEGCNVKLERAKKLTSLLDDENRRWMSEIVRLQEDTLFIEGDAAFGGAMLTFAGPFPTAFREQMQADFLDCLDELQIPRSRDTSMVRCLGDDVRIQGWGLHGLPKDPTSIENGIILDLSLRWTFLIDPQRQGLKYLKNSARDHESGFEVVKYSDKGLMKKLEQSIHFGKIFIIENCPSKLDPGLDPLLNKKIGKANGSLTLTLGEKMIPYSTNFKLLLVSCQENPEFSPEVCAKVTIINFNATPTGLVEQMLATIVILENRQLEDQKNDILRKNAIDKRALVKYEDEILKTLNESNQDFLNSNSLINKLATSKRTSSEIKTRVQDSKMTEAKIDAVRETYRPLAIQVSKLYFAICDLSKLDPMYEYSLQWFDQLFRTAVESAELSNDLQKRSHFLISKFTEILFKNVSRSLFEKHKLLFSFLLCTRLMQIEHRLDPKELHFLISPPSDARLRENPTEYIPETIWPSFYKKLVGLSSLKKFKEMEKAFFLNPTSFKYLCESESPLEATLPNFLETSLNGQDFSRLLLVKLFREDKLISSIQSFVSKTLGELYIKPPPLNLLECFADSTPSTPLVFLLSSGSDPKADFDKLAEELEINDIKSISLGSGQGRRAEEMILKAMKTGAWILLQNCHLAPSWMPKLEEICEGLSETISKDFRLWLTSKPSSRFPVSILQNSIKITLEPPRGLNANLKKTFLSFDEEAFNEKSPVLRKLTYALSFFHAVIQERRGFGPIGWNIPYSFTFEDFQVSLKQLDSILQSHKDVPFKVLNFLVAEINYGGRVTDDKDERLIRSLLKNYFCPEIFKKTYALSESGKYLSPPVLDRDEYLDFIDRDIPLLPESEVFFLHKNAEITTNENNAQQFTRQFMTMEFNQVGSADASSNVKSTRLIQSIRDKVPQCFDQENVSSKYPTQYEESMNTVLNQEVIRFNALIRKVRLDLHQLEKALQGQQILSKELEVVQQTLERLEVPKAWGYPLGFLSLKSLNSWLEDLLQRHEFLKDWITLGKPGIFWFSGFFFPQAFITGTLQNYARKYNIAIDRVAFDFVIKDDLDEAEVLSSRRGPADGVYVNGIFLEGAQWSRSFGRLDQPVNRKLFAECPVIHLLPRLAEDVKTEGMYECPLYKVVSRQGSLNTTGHSNNFVMYLRFRSELSQDYWIRRGVAAFLSLSY